jgi:hypothetical protein
MILFYITLNTTEDNIRKLRLSFANYKLLDMPLCHIKCAYCKDMASETEFMSNCSDCGAFLHFSCFNDYGSCPVFGCSSKKIVVQIPGVGRILSGKYIEGECSFWRLIKDDPSISQPALA